MRTSLLGLLALAGCGSSALSPDAPAAVRASTTVARASLPPIAPSVVDAPISYALTPALSALEQAVPRRFGDINKRIVNDSNTRQSIAFAATRTPFEVTFDGKRLTLTTIVTYQGRGWFRPPIGPTVSASCGAGEKAPRLRIVLSSDVDVKMDWQLQTRTRLRSLTPYTTTERDQCRVTMFNIDVTDRVVKAVTPMLAKQLPRVDRKIAAFDVRTRVEGWYNLLNKSIRVQDSLWLVLSPTRVRLGGLRMVDTALVADIRLVAQPMLVTGPRPPDITSVLPVLEPVTRAVGDSAHLLLEGLLGYDVASTLLQKQLAGRHIRRFGRKVTIDRARLYPLGDGRVALAIEVSGAVSGNAYFVGTPKLDTLTRTLAVPDLDFDVATANALVSSLAWLKKGDLLTELRQRAQVPLEPILEETRARVEHALNRQLTEGVILSGRVQAGRLLDVAADSRWLVVRAEATGSLGLAVDKEITIGRARQKKTKSVTDTAATRGANR